MEETSPKATSDEHIKKTFDKTSTLASDLKQHLKLIPVSLEILKENAAKSGNAEVLQYIKHQETPFIKDVKEISDLIPKVEISFHKMDVQMRDTKGRIAHPTDSGIGSESFDKNSCNSNIFTGIQDTNPPDCTEPNTNSFVLFQNNDTLEASEDC